MDERLTPCRDRQDLFLDPVRKERPEANARRVLAAKELCRGCFVQVECLARALERREPNDIWGGLTSAERDEILEVLDTAKARELETVGG